jgi:hypothetical protein
MTSAYAANLREARPTRFIELGYAQHARNLWRFIDMETGAAIGPLYPTKTELLADVGTFYVERWGARA